MSKWVRNTHFLVGKIGTGVSIHHYAIKTKDPTISTRVTIDAPSPNFLSRSLFRGWSVLHQACVENRVCSHEETIRVLVHFHQLNLFQVCASCTHT